MATLCRDMPKTHFDGTTTIKKKDAKESGMSAALRYLTEQADGWCESGLCSNGKCRGVMSNTHVKLVSETANECTIEFSVDISCECPPVAEAPPPTQPAPAPPLTAAQQQQAVADKMKLLTHYNELIAQPVPEPELSAFRQMREALKQFLLVEINSLIATPQKQGEFWKELAKFIIIEGIGEILKKLLGVPLGPLVHILGDPSQISGVETQEIDTLIVRKLPDSCYKITWYRTRWADELIWGPVRIKIEKIPCN